MWCNFKFEGVLFRSDSRHNDRVDSLLECATKQAVMTVAQWHRNQISRGKMRPPLANEALCLSTPKHNGKSGIAFPFEMEMSHVSVFFVVNFLS
jgi:hypothetical protein